MKRLDEGVFHNIKKKLGLTKKAGPDGEVMVFGKCRTLSTNTHHDRPQRIARAVRAESRAVEAMSDLNEAIERFRDIESPLDEGLISGAKSLGKKVGKAVGYLAAKFARRKSDPVPLPVVPHPAKSDPVPLPVVPHPAKKEVVGKVTRCPRGSRKNKKTAKCMPTKGAPRAAAKAPQPSETVVGAGFSGFRGLSKRVQQG